MSDKTTLTVKGIDPDDYRLFRTKCVFLGLTASQVIKDFIRDFVNNTPMSFNRKGGE